MALKKEYPYTYARVTVMKSKLLKKSDYDKLQKMSLGEIIKFLSEKEYKKEIEKFGVTKEGIELVDLALLENTSNVYNKLKRISDSGVKELIETYLLRNDMHNIKTILRSITAKKEKEETKQMLVKATKKKEMFFEDLLREQEVEKVIKKLTFLNNVKLHQALKSFQETGSLIMVENTLDHYLYDEIFKLKSKVPNDSKIKNYLRAEIQAINFKMLLKLKAEKKSSSEIIPLLIKPKKETVQLAEKSFEDIIKNMKKTIFKDVNENDTILSIESKIDKRAIQIVQKLLSQKPLSADIILGYLFAKEIEMRNIRLITKAKEFGLNDEFVESQLVVAK